MAIVSIVGQFLRQKGQKGMYHLINTFLERKTEKQI